MRLIRHLSLTRHLWEVKAEWRPLWDAILLSSGNYYLQRRLPFSLAISEH